MCCFRICLLGVLLALSSPGALAAQAVGTLPNVVLIVAEDLGFGDLGCYGATLVETPNIDKLAARGRKFVDAHSASAASSPSRYALLTGEYPFRAANGAGIWAPASNTSALLLDPEQVTLADIFKQKGYATAMIGHWQMGFGSGGVDWEPPLSPGPRELGFDYFYGLPVINSVSPFVYVKNEQIVGYDSQDPLIYVGPKHSVQATPLTPLPAELDVGQRSDNVFSGAARAHELYNDYEHGEHLSAQAVAWIQSQSEEPFFLYYSAIQNHHPYTPAPQFQGSSSAGVYGDTIHELDWIVGEIVDCLQEQGRLDDTLIIFTSDNGGMFSQIAQQAYQRGHAINGPLLGYKFGAWEGGHRVPFIVSWPDQVEPATVSNQLICTMDLFATFAALTQQSVKAPDSINMLDAFLDTPQQPIREQLVISARQESMLSLRDGKWMYLPFQGSAGFSGKKPGRNNFAGPAAATFTGRENNDISRGRIKKMAAPAQLYDLEADLKQTRNLYYEYPQVVEQMAASLEQCLP
jgi:arylsulfatase A-like enzyme